MFTSTTSPAGTEPVAFTPTLRGRVARKLAPTIVAVAALAAILGGTAENANAAVRFSDGSTAQLEVRCDTYLTSGLEGDDVYTSFYASSPGIWAQVAIYVDGVYKGGTGWRQTTQGYAFGTAAFYSGPRTVGGPRISDMVQWAKVVNGAWQYSAWEYAFHSERTSQLNWTGGTRQTGNSCTFA